MQTSSIVAGPDFSLECFVRGFWQLRGRFRWILAAALIVAWGRLSLAQTLDATEDLNSCRVHQVKSLPGSHQFGSEFIVAMANDPDPNAKDANAVWALTADLAKKVPATDRAMY